jgi:hypothetical protein
MKMLDSLMDRLLSPSDVAITDHATANELASLNSNLSKASIASITDIYIARRAANKLFFLFNHFNGFVSRQ